ncbi:MAG: AAA family ATPase [Chloroflexi bacterium]|nr:AAA family ATPase [Chloroflexota bacterium]
MQAAVSQEVVYHLPVPTTPFIGRKNELVELSTLVRNPACRLLTLVGPGGIGKTRLALEVAARHLELFADGVYFVGLDALGSPDFMVGAVAEAVGYRLHESGDCDCKEQLLSYLRPMNALLVLDNLEHLLDGVSIVADILTAAPHMKIIVTSREVLNLQEEWLWPVPGMRFPAENETETNLEEYSAVQLFVRNAQRIRSEFSFEAEREGVIRICALVEGSPLALELAAAWVRSLSCDEIAREIMQNLDFLKTRARNVLPRHQSMRAVLDHSWELLTEEEQMVFRRLAVFRGGFTRDAAAAVAEGSLAVLTALVDKSLLRWNNAGRYGLHELVRQYAERQLKDLPDDFGNTRERHSTYYLTLLRQQWPRLLGGEPRQALHEIELELDNIRPAWTWAVMQDLSDVIDGALDSLWFFYDTRSWYREGEKVLALAAESLKTDSPETDGSLLLGRIMARQGVLCNSIGRSRQARPLLESALAIFRRLNARAEMAFALSRLGEAVIYEPDPPYAREVFAQSLALYEETGDAWGQAFALSWLGNLADDDEESMHLHERSLALFQSINSQWGIAFATPLVGFSALSLGDFQRGLRLGHESVARCQEIGIRWAVAMSYQVLGVAAHHLRDYQAALDYFVQGLEGALELRLDRFVMYCSMRLARIVTDMGHHELGIALAAVAYRLYHDPVTHLTYVSFDEELTPDQFTAVRARSEIIEPGAEIKRILAELHQLQADASRERETSGEGESDTLTEREIEILARVSTGLSNRDIADELYLSTGTVKWYLSQIYGKLGVNSRTQAVAKARTLQLIA